MDSYNADATITLQVDGVTICSSTYISAIIPLDSYFPIEFAESLVLSVKVSANNAPFYYTYILY